MANTSMVYARVNTELKNEVESILKELGMTPSSLIQMLYSEIRLTKRVPLSLSLRNIKYVDEMSEDELLSEIDKGISDIKNGNVHSKDEVDVILKRDLGI